MSSTGDDVHTELNFLKEQLQKANKRIAALEDRVKRQDLLWGNIAWHIREIEKLPKACGKCERNPDEVEGCSDEACPVGLYTRS